MNKKLIKHWGTVTKVEPGQIVVTIQTVSACHSCDAKGACSVSDQKDREVVVNTLSGREFQIGQQVQVVLKSTAGFKAVIWAYLIPFFILLATLLVTDHSTGNQAMAGLLALGAVLLYYLALYLFRRPLASSFEITVD